MLIEYLNFILNDIKNKKLSSFLTFFAICFGILSIFTIILISQGFEQSIEKEFEKMGSNRIIVSSKNNDLMYSKKGLTDNEVKIIENKPFIIQVSPHYFKSTQIKYSNEYKKGFVFGCNFDKEYFEDFNVEIEKGRYPKPSDKYGIIIGPEFAKNLFKKELRVGSNLYIKDKKFKVIGILKSVGNPEDDKNAYVNIDSFRNLNDVGDQVGVVYAKVNENYNVDLAVSNIKIALENKLGSDTVEVQTFAQMLESFNEILKIVQLTLGGIAFVSLIVGAIGIINTMFVVITEKTKDIGIMKAVGAKNIDIFFLYSLQAGIFGFLGALVGVIFGSFCGFGFEFWAKSNGFIFLEINIELILVLELLLFGFIVGVLSGFLPSYKASKLKIVDTFRK
jgi:putative ABC transport system permease protein